MTKTKIKPRLNAQIRDEATEWLVAFCQGEVDAAARENFNVWLRTSPEHVRAYLRVSAFWEEVDQIDKDRKRDIVALVQRALAESNVVPLGTAAERPYSDLSSGAAEAKTAEGRAPSHSRLAIAASLLIVCFGAALLVWSQFDRSPTYTTAIGEQRTITLRDGSTVELNARSRIKVRFSESERLIDLLQGQALFRVAKNAARPFIVHSDGTSVKAVGTQFDVYRRSDRTVVTVLEGRVAISEPVHPRLVGVPVAVEKPAMFLSAGEQVTVTAQAIIPSKRANLAASTAWTEGLLVFDSAPLSEVVQEFNRHNIRPLIVDDTQLRKLQISGIFPSKGAERITEFLRERFGVVVHETDEDIRISTQ